MVKNLYKKIEKDMLWFSEIQNNGLPEDILLHFWVDIIWSGITGKYTDIDRESVCSLAKDWIQAKSLSNESVSVRDVYNQFTALDKVEHEWHQRRFDLSLVVDLYAEASGTNNAVDPWRKSQFEIFNGFSTPVIADDIIPRMAEFGAFLEAVDFTIKDAPLRTILWIISLAHSRMIFIHPFPDANGRVARLLVNAILRRGGFPYIPIPKVRNSQSFLLALQDSFVGNYAPLVDQYANLLSESLREAVTELKIRGNTIPYMGIIDRLNTIYCMPFMPKFHSVTACRVVREKFCDVD
ncbi:MAG: Fic family protein [Candidatus Desantisbacteria bacterium]